ncbi:MAG: MotA/TolQ/ExbB proton channel family protein [Candidatus Omnitrophica bacterium]|jgi:biopolymer transport protein ExbB/TolQ|nr:MotA/TolQ/ExbB proton channel family protein [Candidatus Omnitrophota bacterium]
MGLWQLIKVGGFTMVILLAASVFSVAIILERLIYYRAKSRLKRKDFMYQIRQEINAGNFNQALKICQSVKAPFVSVVNAGLIVRNSGEKEIANSMDRQLAIEASSLERFTAVIGTIGSVAVYIGLFGTVLGIIRAFHDISVSGSGGISVVINGISEALACTAAGLCVAIPAVVAYNFFTHRIELFIRDMELAASETADLLSGLKNDR